MLGKLALTTYHSAKGREFQIVVLPGLVDCTRMAGPAPAPPSLRVPTPVAWAGHG